MSALTDNFLADMRGPDFLVLYGIVALAVVLGVIFLGVESEQGEAPPPPVPAQPDPYELAYLREGPAGVVWLAIYKLRRAGLIELTKGRIRPIDDGKTPDGAYESATWRAIGSGCAPSQIIRNRRPEGSVASLIRSLEARLVARGLVRDPSHQQRVLRAALWAGAALTAFALYKAAIATANGHRNIGGLFIECAIALVALAIVRTNFRRPRASRQGRAYLDRVKMVFTRALPDADNAAPARDNPSLAAVLVGLYGFQILTGGPEAAFAQQARAAQSSGGCGGSGCSGGGGGGCGGGGGGGCGGCGGT